MFLTPKYFAKLLENTLIYLSISFLNIYLLTYPCTSTLNNPLRFYVFICHMNCDILKSDFRLHLEMGLS